MTDTVLTRRRLFAAAAASAVVSAQPALASGSRFQAETSVWTGVELQDQNGRSFTLRDSRQPITLLKLWAGWCPACATEMAPLANLAASMAQDLDVLLISHPEYWEADVAAARRRKLPFRLATFAGSTPASLVQRAVLDQAGRYTVPRSLVFRQRDCSIVSQAEGSLDWSREATVGKVRAWLG